MKTLSIVRQPSPGIDPEMGKLMDGLETVVLTARVVPKRGDEFYLCNPMDEIIAARSTHEPFVAHSVVGMKAKRIIIEPGTIARIEEV